MSIHPSAIIEDGAELGADVEIGPMCHVGARARLHDGVALKSHVVVTGLTEIGPRTRVYPFAVLGGPPQHLGYKGEDTKLVIGADAIIREYVTMNPGTEKGGGVTRIGERGFFMIGAHVAHDCQIGDDVIFANNATLGGHVQIGDRVFLGGLCAIHQFSRVGAFAFVSGCAALAGDVIPYGYVTGNRAYLEGLNIIGMKRSGMGRETIHALRDAYRLLFGETETFKERLARVREKYGDCKEVMRIVDFVDGDGGRALVMPAR